MLVRGTRLVTGDEAWKRRQLLRYLAELAVSKGYEEVILPSLEFADLYKDKMGEEVLGQMYVFPDRKGRELCLRPEGTATLQLMAREEWKSEKDVKVFYETRCWRYERPQAGRYREFTQFGVEVLNPTKDWMEELSYLAERMVWLQTSDYEVNYSAKRGLAYYEGDGFEISVPALGAQKQVVGGGRYAEGVGFALGVDRLMLAPKKV